MFYSNLQFEQDAKKTLEADSFKPNLGPELIRSLRDLKHQDALELKRREILSKIVDNPDSVQDIDIDINQKKRTLTHQGIH